jgi:hypothetical protein
MPGAAGVQAMRKSSVFAVAALLFLLAVLLGSWVYLASYPWPFDDEPAIATRDSHPAADDPFEPYFWESDQAAEEPAVEPQRDTDGETVEAGLPPEPVEARPHPAPAEVSTRGGSTIVATLVPGRPGVRAAEGEQDLEPFIVSTLGPALARTHFFPLPENLGDAPGARNGLVGKTPAAADGSGLFDENQSISGRLIWPELEEEAADLVKREFRRQAVVYLEQRPEMRSVVDADEGWFVLPLPKKLEKEYRAKGLKLVVHSPAFEIEGGFESVLVKKDNGPIRVNLQLAPVLTVTVDVTPVEAVQAGVRVWLERRGGDNSPDYDDSLYMSAKVPESGRLHFTVPERYGELRVGAAGAHWHSGLPRVVRLRQWKTARVNVSLDLANEPCELVSGQVVQDDDQPVAAARLESTHYGTTVYSAPDGRFSIHVPFDRFAGARQFHVFAPRLRPEIVPLEARATGTPGVQGGGFGGPFRVTLASEVSVLLDARSWAIKGAGKGKERAVVGMARLTISAKKAAREEVTLPWGVRFVMLWDDEETRGTVVYIQPGEWNDAFKDYANGAERAPRLTATELKDLIDR